MAKDTPPPSDETAHTEQEHIGGTMNLRAEVLARMGHELRTPLNSIIGFIKLVEDGLYVSEEERRDYLGSARQSAITLLELINNILDLARIESGRLTLESVEVNLTELLEEVARALAPEAHAKGVEIDAVVSGALPTRLKCDPVRLRQVLYNLAGNAVKFTDSGLVILRADVEASTSAHSRRIRFSVQDSGIGIPADQREAIFESFVQTHHRKSDLMGGIGLGLSIAKQIVEQMGAVIQVDSSVDQGSTFWFDVDLAQVEAFEAGEEDRRSGLDGIHALVINPDDRLGALLVEKLTVLGVEAQLVPSVDIALDAVEAAQTSGNPHQVVLVDHSVPQNDALVLGRRIRQQLGQRQPALIHLGLVGVLSDPAPLRVAGFSGFVTKPAALQSLSGVLHSVLERGAPDGANAVIAGSTSRSAPLVRSSGIRAHILVAEDNAVNQKLMLALLSKLGFTAHVVDNGQQAIEAVDRERFDLVLMDVQMPVVDGLSAARAIRNLPDGQDVPIIAMTADALDGDQERCLAAGMNDYVPKPILPNVLQEALHRWLGSTGKSMDTTDTAPSIVSSESDVPDLLLDVAHLDTVYAYTQRYDPSRFQHWLGTFRSEMRAALDALRKASSQKDLAAALNAGYRIERAGAGFGSPRLHGLATHTISLLSAGALPDRSVAQFEATMHAIDMALAARYGQAAQADS